MNRKKSSEKQFESSKPSLNKEVKKNEESVSNLRGIREIVESLVVALVLAFLFKAFAAEAFVIPTGSMASTLMGRHKDICCEQCGFPFQISASEESADASEFPRERESLARVVGGTCPQCRWTNYVGADNFKKKTFLSFNGDRIFVNKSQFDFRNPSRWHVTVFRYPGKPQINYIKRLVGLENETVRIRHGDIFVKKEGAEDFEIQRKPLRALLAMLRPVDDNDYVQPKLHETGWPTRWSEMDKEIGQWNRSDDFKTFRTHGKTEEKTAWLQFRNIVPASDDWFYLSQDKIPPQGMESNPQLITDFVGYNSGLLNVFDYRDSSRLISIREIKEGEELKKEHFCRSNTNGMGLNWVGDLALSCRLTVEKPEGSFFLRLIKGGEEFLCEIDLSTGKAMLSIPCLSNVEDQIPLFQAATTETSIRPGQSFDLMFCNIDEEMRLIVDGKEIDFNGKGRYDMFCGQGGPLSRDRSPNSADLTPAAFGVRGAVVKIEHLKVQRDMYYIACNEHSMGLQHQCDLLKSPFANDSVTENSVYRVLSTPELWGGLGKTNTVEITLGKDEFLMLGDNSAKSQDSRLWTTYGIPPGVHRDLLIGEAVFVYWPHGFRIPGTRLALIPNVSKMRFID